MKKMLTTALAFTAMASAAFAQQTEQIVPKTLPLIERTESVHQPMPGREHMSVSEETDYFWNSNIFRRYGTAEDPGDTNRRDLTVPLDFGSGTEMRGFGQFFAPRTFYPFFNGTIYNAESGRVSRVDQNFASDQDYIDQFKNAGAYTVREIGFPLFRNPQNTPSNPGLITLYKTTFNFLGTAYKRAGFSSGRQQMTKLMELEISQDKGLDTTITTTEQGDSVVNSTYLDFRGTAESPTAISDPLELKATESLLILYTNEFAPAVVQPINNGDTREWQRVIATEEYGSGDIVPDPDNPGQFLDQRANPLDSFKTFAVVMFRNDNHDSIYSAWSALVFGSGADQRRAISDINVSFAGTIELGASGVQYHFGKDAKAQGLGNIAPNPVREKAEISFSLVGHENVRIDLYDVKGEHLKNLVDSRFVEGNYSCPLNTADLANGIYLVRMIAGDQVYTQKVTVNK
jgi:hypothetical protein